jgi:hypothetical protein
MNSSQTIMLAKMEFLASPASSLSLFDANGVDVNGATFIFSLEHG